MSDRDGAFSLFPRKRILVDLCSGAERNEAKQNGHNPIPFTSLATLYPASVRRALHAIKLDMTVSIESE